MKTILKLSLSLLIIVLMNSCITLHSGVANFPQNNPTGKMTYVKTNVMGHSTTTYILGLFGGSTRDALVADAKADLSKFNPLSENQAYTNTTVNVKSDMILMGLIVKATCVITADIVEYK